MSGEGGWEEEASDWSPERCWQAEASGREPSAFEDWKEGLVARAGQERGEWQGGVWVSEEQA